MATRRPDPANGRTHEPSLREITGDVDALRELMDERDRRYEDRFNAQQKAVEAALAAQEKQTLAAFNSGEKAIAKQEAAQASYNERTNEFRGQLADQARTFIPRIETEQGFKQVALEIERIREEIRREHDGLKKEIASLRETRSAIEGAGTKQAKDVSMIVAIIGAITAILGTGYIVLRVP